MIRLEREPYIYDMDEKREYHTSHSQIYVKHCVVSFVSYRRKVNSSQELKWVFDFDLNLALSSNVSYNIRSIVKFNSIEVVGVRIVFAYFCLLETKINFIFRLNIFSYQT